MATKSIAWTTGTGNILLTYTGQGNGTITVASSQNNLYSDRSQNITVKTSNNAIAKTLTIRQGKRSYAYDTGYISNGLVFALDGIIKGDESGYWTDLIGGIKFTLNSSCTANSNRITFSGTGLLKSNSTRSFPYNNCTIEVVARRNGDGFIFHSNYSNNLSFYIREMEFASSVPNKPMVSRRDTDLLYSVNADVAVINGRQVFKSSRTDSWDANTNVLSIGGRSKSSGDDRLFAGDIYAIRIYNRKLSVSEMKQNQAIDNNRFNLGIYMLDDYISSGLVFRLDGINKGNNGNGWTDLIGNVFFEYSTFATAGNNHVSFNGTGTLLGQITETYPQSSCTIEAVYDNPNGYKILLYPTSQGQIILIHNTSTKMLYHGSSSAPRTITTVDSDTQYFVGINDDSGIINTLKGTKGSNDSWGAGINPTYMQIGGRIGATNYCFIGNIYAIRIYNRKLTDSEIIQNQRLDNIRFGFNNPLDAK